MMAGWKKMKKRKIKIMDVECQCCGKLCQEHVHFINEDNCFVIACMECINKKDGNGKIC